MAEQQLYIGTGDLTGIGDLSYSTTDLSQISPPTCPCNTSELMRLMI